MIGILGLTKVENEEGSSGYYLALDRRFERPFGMKELWPNLH